jgi:FkbM family methyltransferase
LLTENLSLTDLAQLVEARQVALSDRPGRLRMYLSTANSGDHRLGVVAGETRPSEEVEVTTLDALLERSAALKPPFLLKLDIQGCEVKALSAAARILSCPCLMVAECWPEGLAAAGSSLQHWARLNERFHLRAYELGREKPPVLRAIPDFAQYDPLRHNRHFANVLLTNMDLQSAGLSAWVGQ